MPCGLFLRRWLGLSGTHGCAERDERKFFTEFICVLPVPGVHSGAPTGVGDRAGVRAPEARLGSHRAARVGLEPSHARRGRICGALAPRIAVPCISVAHIIVAIVVIV